MVIWVKEFNTITVGSVRIWIKNEIPVLQYKSNLIEREDYIIISREDTDVQSDNFKYGTILLYEDMLEKITKYVFQAIGYNYDYYYLRNAMDIAKNSNIDTLITGSSYGLFGIDQNQLTSEVNTSLSSQDLYYSYLIIKDT